MGEVRGCSDIESANEYKRGSIELKLLQEVRIRLSGDGGIGLQKEVGGMLKVGAGRVS
jgi:hypothetical protein